jgi:predicted membrane-bound dolichyl-phosphate-mannose-protein mannosyltransferase
MKSTKSKVVEHAEYIYQNINLKCLEIEKSLHEVDKTDWAGNKRTYVIPTQIYYRFSYTWNGKYREIEIVRRNGNPHPLSSNIRVEIVKQLAEELKKMVGIIITKGGKAL